MPARNDSLLLPTFTNSLPASLSVFSVVVGTREEPKYQHWTFANWIQLNPRVDKNSCKILGESKFASPNKKFPKDR